MKYCIVCFFLVTNLAGFSQAAKKSPNALNKQKSSRQYQFLRQQWWLGFKAGVNLTQADPVKRYTILTPTDYPAAKADKKYDRFNAIGAQASVEISFQYNNFLISTQPAYRQSVFTYSNQFSWVNLQNVSQSLTQTYQQQQKVNYADFPLIVKYTFGDGNFKPFVHAGIYYSLLVNATQTVNVSGTDQASGGANSFSAQPVIIGAKSLFANYWSLGAGAGVTWQLGNVQLVLDASYRKGMSNVTNVSNRYSSDRLSGIGDVQDDLKLSNIVVSAGVLFPMRFLNNNFTSRQH